ncbi:MAG: AsmA family protein, partial [Gallionella sp.]
DPTAGDEQPLPLFDRLQVTQGLLRYRDEPYAINTEAHISLKNDTSVSARQGTIPASSPAAVGSSQPGNALQLNATGYYHKLPLKIDLASSGVLPLVNNDVLAPLQVNLDATVGSANLLFKGSATDALHLGGLHGRFRVKGPSLAAVGSPLSVTLPTTPAFLAHGQIDKQGDTSHIVIDDATVGGSRLNGTFTYEAARKVPLLSGRLSGPRLLLVDLGPAVGTTPAAPEFASEPTTSQPRNKSRVLPTRPFDLASLRVMDADILIDIEKVDLNTTLLEPLQPLRGHLLLTGGVLSLNDLNTHTGEGKLMGNLQLDARGSKALWNAALHWKAVRLERWIHQKRKNGSPPYISGQLNGNMRLKGEGRSTAEILGSLKGHVRTELRNGKVSHLGVELAGLHVIESLGIFLKGDDELPVQCAVADLNAQSGQFRPRVMVVDTTDSAVWVDGSVSLATETLDLRAVVTPKDFSPLSLRTPLRVRGTFANPKVSLENRPLTLKLGRALLLSLVNPLAALIPLVDKGDIEAAKRAASGCQALMQQTKANLPSTVEQQ